MNYLLQKARLRGTLLAFAALFLFPFLSQATHLQGGEVKYAYLGVNQTNGLHQYRVTFYIYNNCALSSEIPNGKPQIIVNIYNKDTGQRIAGPDNTIQQQGLWLFQRGPNPVITNPLPAGCSIPSVEFICIRYITYERVVELPMSFSGYYVIYDDFARTNTILNLQNSGNAGQSIYTDMASPIRQNSSPAFSDMAVAIVCQGDTVQISNNASDAEGDNLVYSFDLPLNDVLGVNNSPTVWTPPVNVPYAAGFSFAQPFGAGGSATINASTGVTKYYIPVAGDYVIAVLIKEFRTNPDGTQTQIGFTRREIMLFVRACPPNTSPVFSAATLNNLTTTVQAGSQICLPISASDPSGQQITLTAPAGSIPTGATFSPALPAIGTGTLTNQFCWTPPCSASGTVQVPVRVTDNGCPPKFTEQVFTINITPTAPVAFSGLEAGNYCTGSGPIPMTGSPAGGAFSGPGVANGMFSPTVAGPGTHTITYSYTTALGCTQTATQVITVNQGPSAAILGLDSVYCLSSGVVPLTVSPPGGSLSGPGLTGNTFDPALAGPGTKTITYGITSPNGCTSVQTVSTTIVAQPVVTTAPAVTVCSGNSVTLSASGAGSYTWVNNLNASIQTGSQITVAPGATSLFTVTGLVAVGCSATAVTEVTVLQSPTVSATASIPVICSGQTVQLSASGASGYSWQPVNLSGGSITVSPVTNTAYTVIGTNTNGCSDTATVQVGVLPLPVISISGQQSICIGESATLTASGGSNYSWLPVGLSGNSITVSPTNTTTYSVTGTGANGCTNVGIASVTVNNVPVIAVSPNQAICAGAALTLTASGANAYNWLPVNLSGSSITVSPAATTTYSVTGTSSAGCVGGASTTITVNPLPVVTANPAQTVCAGTQVNLSATGASAYTWTPGNSSGASVSVIPASTTTYTVTGTSPAGCTNTATTQVVVNALPAIAVTPSQSVCIGETVTLTATGGVSYSWSPGAGTGNTLTVNPAATSTFVVTGTGSNGCVNSASTIVTVNPLPVLSLSGDSVICKGEQTTLTATGASTYNWSPATGLNTTTGSTVLASPDSTTTYTIVGTSAFGCQSTTATLVTVNTLPQISASPSQTICAGQPVNLTASGTATFTWQPGNLPGNAITVTPVATTLYSVIGTSTDGCSAMATSEVVVNPVPQQVSIIGASTFCTGSTNGLSYTAPGEQGSSYNWVVNAGSIISGNGTATITVDLDGNQSATLSVTETSAAGCAGQPNTLVILFDTAKAEMVVVTVNSDNEQQLKIDWNLPGQIAQNEIQLFRRISGNADWDLVTTLAGSAITYTDSPGNTDEHSFEYQVRTTNSCEDSLKTIPQRSILLNGSAVEATGEVSLSWNSYRGWPEGVQQYELYRKLDNETGFTLVQTLADTSATFTNGREAFSHCYKVKALSNNPITRESWSNSICLTFQNPLLTPNIITPNGDGKNDFFVIDNIKLYPNAELTVMNRWGKEIYRKNNYQNDWSPSNELPEGTYFYQLTLQDKSVIKGWLSIVR